MEGSRKESGKDEIKGNDAKVIPSMDLFCFRCDFYHEYTSFKSNTNNRYFTGDTGTEYKFIRIYAWSMASCHHSWHGMAQPRVRLPRIVANLTTLFI